MFRGIRFVLIGFDSVSEAQCRSELVNGGGVDVGRYDPSCSHVIVHGRVYDDPVCDAARHDGKTLVTELWVEDSLDNGTLADARRILYRPVKDLKGIPGAESLHICLTGYQRKERDDIMKMVDLMGAQFSKPLIASKVTHLICYKFEGEKYELAKKLGKNLVNHRWLEDCLTTWEILPVDNYNMSSWELELMEAEARDSEDETGPDVGALSNLHDGTRSHFPSSEFSKPAREMPKIEPDKIKNKAISYVTEDIPMNNKLLATHCSGSKASTTSASDNFDGKGTEGSGATVACSHAQEDKRASSSGLRATKISPYSRKTQRKSQSITTEKLDHQFASPEMQWDKSAAGVCNLTHLSLKKAESDCRTAEVQSKYFSLEEQHKEVPSDLLPRKRTTNLLKTEQNTPNKKTYRSLEKACNPEVYDDQASNAGPVINNDQSNDEDAVKGMPNELAYPPKTIRTSLVQKTRKGISPFLQTKHSENIFLPPDYKVKDLSRELEPSLTLEKKTPSDEINHAQKSIDHTDVDFMDVVGTETHGRVSAENFTKENILESSQTARADNRDLELSRPFNGLVNDHVVSPQKMDDEVISFNNTGNIENKLSSLQSVLHTGTDHLAPSGKVIRKLTAKRSDIKSKTKIGNSAKRCTDFMDSVVNPVDEDIKDGAEQPTEVANHCAQIPEFPLEASDAVVEDGTHSVNRTILESKSTNMKMLENSEEKKVSIHEVPDMILMKGKRHCMDSTSNISGVNKDVPLSKDTELEKMPSDSLIKHISNSGSKICKEPSVSQKDTSLDPTVIRNQTKKGKATCKVLGVAVKTLKDKKPSFRHKIPIDNKVKNIDAEKENVPAKIGDVSVISNVDDNQTSEEESIKSATKEVGNDAGCLHSTTGSRVAAFETVWFILSGHRLQRKEFQQVIRRLRGRLCRDSHQWSYQATHFIVPDPVRRTEKFFAAAAAGRWILKTDYLTASNQAGRFLDEEPFEWHKKGLSEDGAISLEAPRKWRLLSKQTGHGAFYGMRILIYGECVAPTLDTLKRVVKAGDGSILATSPPYTRFLKSGVDYAIISQGMLRVDSWIQEFLRHEIPCVLADYLVDYVCKPGYPLEQHVLYKTHAWADRSYAKMLSRLEEVVPPSVSPKQDDDIACVVCGSHDRADVMLICGDEEGSVGCGRGTHIDCCDPPLEAVPEEDWFCSKCNSSMNAPVKTKKATKKHKRR